jgi:hypothetical protein
MKDTSAFPILDSYVSEAGNARLDCVSRGMTLTQYAAIHLKVPMSGDKELDAMIRESRRLDIAQVMIQELYEYNWDMTSSVKRTFEFVDALLAQWEKGEAE